MSIHEAERQAELARGQLDVSIVRAAQHITAAWAATREAEAHGVDPDALGLLRRHLCKLGLAEWIWRAAALAAVTRDDAARGAWYERICDAIVAGLEWHADEARQGRMNHDDVTRVCASWLPLLEGFRQHQRAPLA